MNQFVTLTDVFGFPKLMSMKQHAVPVTEEKVRAILKEELCNYPTTDEFSKRLDASFEAFRQENNHNFQIMIDRFDEKFSNFANLILTAIDPLLKNWKHASKIENLLPHK